MSIKTKILIPALIIIAISYLVLGYKVISNNYETHYNNLKEQEIALSSSSAKYVDEYLESKLDIVDALSKQINHFDKQSQLELIRKLLILAKESGGFNSVYVGFEQDGFMTRWSGRDTTPTKDNYDPRTRPWYKSAMSSKKSGVTKPYIDSASKKLTISIYSPIINQGDVIGVVGTDIFLDQIIKTVLDVNIKDYGFAYLVDDQGSILVHKNESLINKLDNTFNQLNKSENFSDISIDGVSKLISFAKIDATQWNFVLEIDKSKAFAKIYEDLMIFALLSILFLLFTSVAFYYVLNKALSVLGRFQSGLLSFFTYLNRETNEVKLLEDSSGDEFGAMAKVVNENIIKTKELIEQDQKLIDEAKDVIKRVKNGWYSELIQAQTQNVSLNEFKNDVNGMIQATKQHFIDVNKVLEQYTKYNYTKALILDDIEKGGVFEHLTDGINELRNSIVNMLKENKGNGLTLLNSSNTLLDNVNMLSSSSNQAAASLEETAAALEQITGNISNNTHNVIQMASYANEVTKSVTHGQELANQTTTSMDEINTEVTAINEAITVIDQIAFQTNILSLNAAVEAATAGEAGKGFAVVAQEVRNLAGRSAEAAKEIKDLVESATNKANDGKKIADDMIVGYTDLNESISKTLELIGDVENASKEQQKGIEQINNAVSQLDKQTQQNASVANNTKNIALETQEIASTVVKSVDEKEYIGKNDIKVQNTKVKPKEDKKQENPKNTTNTITSNTNTKEDDEWESF